MRRAGRRVLALLLVSSCASAPPDAATRSSDATPAAASAPLRPSVDCGPPIRGAEIPTSPGSVTLFGEVHGTNAGPEVLARLVCHAASHVDAKSVLVGLEIARQDQDALEAAVAAADAKTARARLLSAMHFRDEWHDGRDTEAIVALVQQVRALRQAGHAVEIVAFDVDTATADPRGRDAMMAGLLADAIAAWPGATVLALTGNLHSRTKSGAPWDPQFMPMGAHLATKVPSLRALDIATAGGTAWTCISPEPPLRFGVAMAPLPESLAKAVGKPGILVANVKPDSPADHAGLREGDVILERDGKPASDAEQFRAAVADAPANSTLRLGIWRDGARQQLTCKLGDPREAGSEPLAPTCGEHPLRGEDRGADPFIELYDQPDAGGHHGRWYVGPVRASPPAGPDAD